MYESSFSSLFVSVEQNLCALRELACKSRVACLVVQECTQPSVANEFSYRKLANQLSKNKVSCFIGFFPSALRAGLKLKRFPSQHSCSENRSKPVSQVLPATGGRSLSNRLLQLSSSVVRFAHLRVFIPKTRVNHLYMPPLTPWSSHGAYFGIRAVTTSFQLVAGFSVFLRHRNIHVAL